MSNKNPIYEESDDDILFEGEDNSVGLSNEDSTIISNDKKNRGQKVIGIIFFGLALIFILFYWLITSLTGNKTVEEKEQTQLVTNTQTFNSDEFLPPEPEPEPEPIVKTLPPLPETPKPELQDDPILSRKMSGGMVLRLGRGSTSTTTTNTSASTTANSSASLTPAEDKSFLAEKYTPTVTNKVVANRIQNPALTVGKGTIIPCSLETEIKSDQVGMVTCIVNRDVYSIDGQVPLMEKGTRLSGEYQSGIVRGQTSLFVLWTQARTPSPNHVVVDLNSPSAGQLGAAGVQGYVDNHFFERFGAAIMFSAINLGLEVGVQKASDEVDVSEASDYTSEIVASILEKTIDIPPTLFKPHGEQVNVILARDLDFSSVYKLVR